MLNTSFVDNYRELLEKEGTFGQLVYGISMYPMLVQKRDTVIIEKLDGRPKENDVVLYQRDNGKYVLHRVIRVKDDGYVIRGDNCQYNEYDIKDRHLIGRLAAFYKKDKYVDCKNSKSYKLYIVLNRGTYYIRFPYYALRGVLSKIKHTLFK